MKSKIFMVLYTVVIALLTIGLVVFMIIHILNGLVEANDKLILGVYALMILWALMKLHTAIKSLRDKSNDK